MDIKPISQEKVETKSALIRLSEKPVLTSAIDQLLSRAALLQSFYSSTLVAGDARRKMVTTVYSGSVALKTVISPACSPYMCLCHLL